MYGVNYFVLFVFYIFLLWLVMNDKLVSVVIPTYNRSKTLKRALDSVIIQDYRPIEIIIIDDCSNDGTQDMLKNYNSGDVNIKYFYNKTNL